MKGSRPGAMNRIAVYCGSSSGDSSLFKLAATELGALIASRGMALVYGGARIGLMGAVADAALAAGGEVIGVIPEVLKQDEVVHKGLTHLEVVGSMHERKARMLDLADAAVAMPGGLGTLDELFEALTWAQLRFHAKPIGMLNIDGYFDALLSFLDQSVSTGFLSQRNRQLLLDATTPELLIHRLLNAS
jgi:uncharacterized protein (TIGR00730 family)